MSMLAVQGCTVEASLEEGVGSITTSPQITTAPSIKDFVIDGSDKGIYFDKVSVLIPSGTIITLNTPPTGASSPTSIPLVAPATIKIEGTADNILDGSDKKALQQDDEGSDTITFSFLDTASPPTPSITQDVKVIVKITDAGQTLVEAL